MSRREKRVEKKIVIGTITLVTTVIGICLIVPQIRINRHKQVLKDCVNKTFCPGRITAIENLVKASLPLDNINLKAAHLSTVNLSFAKMEAANLTSADLSKANLNNARLVNADLSNVILKGAKLKRANLSGAKLHNVKFEGVDLSGAKLDGASLEKADFRSVEKTGLGLTIYKKKSGYYVNIVYKDSPAEIAGIKEKDKIIFLNEQKIKHINPFEIYEYIFNKPGYKVSLTISRDGIKQDYQLTSEVFTMSVLGLNTEQIKLARNWEKADYDPLFRKELGL